MFIGIHHPWDKALHSQNSRANHSFFRCVCVCEREYVETLMFENHEFDKMVGKSWFNFSLQQHQRSPQDMDMAQVEVVLTVYLAVEDLHVWDIVIKHTILQDVATHVSKL